ncbi:hypothetical protein KC929_00560 [Patescibacteria group bacterium]|nr:hypothetical protein [Patescibacteria group bacterium]
MKIYKNIFDENLHEYLRKLNFKTDTQKIDQNMVEKHITLSLDNNPVHMNLALAKKSHFKRPVVHGPLISSLSTGWIHHIFTCTEYTYPVQLQQNIKNLTSLTIGDSICYIFECSEVVLRNEEGRDPYLKVVYEISCFDSNNNEIMKIEWYIRYYSSDYLLQNNEIDS